MDLVNPFALARASDYTDQQINSLWVEIGATAINTIIEPRSRVSKYILGGKGTGKTHLLRYYSYQVSRLRFPKSSGLSILAKNKFLAIFLRATGVDAARFEVSSEINSKWQQLFAIYLELRLVEGLVDALCDIKVTSSESEFNDVAFIEEMQKHIIDKSVGNCKTISEFRNWIIDQRRSIDDAINNAAFSGSLELRIPFSIGALCLPIIHAIGKWNSSLQDLPLIYLIDEIENFSTLQQEVVNSLIRYGGGLTTFRVTGRLYARKTFSTLAHGEENREGSEFKTIKLDDVLREYQRYPDFAKQFVAKRLASAGMISSGKTSSSIGFDPQTFFDEIDTSNFYSNSLKGLNGEAIHQSFTRRFIDTLKSNLSIDESEAKDISSTLTQGLPLILQKLSILVFCKKHSRKKSSVALAKKIQSDAMSYFSGTSGPRSTYATAYGHYASDLFAQLCRESKKLDNVPYGGFDTFVRMSSGNPRNLLIILGRAYAIAAFRGLDFTNEHKLSIALQTEAAIEASRFMYEADTNFGSQSELARNAVDRLASLLRTARYALNIPEVSPLTVSFSDTDLTPESQRILSSALNYSFIFEISEGRPDRNSQRLNRKLQLNPLLSPRWGLPISRRGDINLSSELLNSIFDPKNEEDFEINLRSLNARWNNPFRSVSAEKKQEELF